MDLSSTEIASRRLFLPHALVARRLGRAAIMQAELDSAAGRAEATLRGRDTLPPMLATWAEAELGFVRALQGRREEARQLTRHALVGIPPGSTWYMRTQVHELAAYAFTLAGDADAAVEELELQLREPWLITRTRLQRDPFWDPLREQPRFRRLLEGAS
jgi:hypothetical protein